MDAEITHEFATEGEYQCYLRSCAGKDSFPSVDTANAYILLRRRNTLNKGGGRRNPEWDEIEAYGPCKFCRNFHVGHVISQ